MSKLKKSIVKTGRLIFKENLFASIAYVSLAINIVFFIIFVMYTSTNHFDGFALRQAKENYCVDNYQENLNVRSEEFGDPTLAIALMEVECQSGDFLPYLEDAQTKYFEDVGVSDNINELFTIPE